MRVYESNFIIALSLNLEKLSDYFERVLDYNLVEKFFLGSYDPEFQKILHIVLKNKVLLIIKHLSVQALQIIKLLET